MKTRLDVIQFLIKELQYDSYLEIGCDKDQVFRHIKIEKVGVDPIRGGTLRMTSDKFFEQSQRFFDIIFIDGLHHHEQVKKDIENALVSIHEYGTIIVHDCNPIGFLEQQVPRMTKKWNGDVWKAWLFYRWLGIDRMVCVDCDYGVGVIRLGTPNNSIDKEEYTWEEFNDNRDKLLNLVSFDEFIHHDILL